VLVRASGILRTAPGTVNDTVNECVVRARPG
jgi:hypothetical protein